MDLDRTAQVAISWAASEGWNPGLDDAERFLAADPDSFLATERETQPSTIVMNRDAFEDLSDDQQGALREAAAEVFNERSGVVNRLQGEDLQVVCGMGPKLVEATPSQREALEAAVEPVYRMIERSPATPPLSRRSAS
jgi:TRAP-type C4-dicarboxylate transport system substrate-binding protein